MLYFYALWLLVMNCLAFLLMWLDKSLARGRRRRIPERTLLTVAALGGCFGGTLAMLLFRHKTKVPKFMAGLPLLCVAWAGLTLYLLTSGSLET